MKRRTLLTAVAALVAAVLAALFVNRVRYDRGVDRRVDDLLAGATTTAPAGDDPVTADELADLPAPVRRYFERVLPDGATAVQTARIEQRGQFRLGDADAPWKPMAATQHVTTDPPGFVWDADIAVAPFLPARVVDAYEDGTGSLRAKLLSTVTVADAEQTAALDRGELMRYLAEAVWYPTALLPGNGVTWEPIHDRAARATIEDGDTTASLTFYFGADGLVARVVGERPRRTADGDYELTRWTGYWRDYEERSGVVVPTSGAVEWNLADGDLPYWRATVESIAFE